MGSKTILKRLKDRALGKIKEQNFDDYEIEDTVIEKVERLETINTEIVSKDTVFSCSKCGMRNRLNNGKCIRCDYNLA